MTARTAPGSKRTKRMWGVFTARGEWTGYRPTWTKAGAHAIADNSNRQHPGNPQWIALPVIMTWTSPKPKPQKRKGKR